MTFIDWGIIFVYLLSMIALGFFLGRGQSDIEAYYVGGRKFKWWLVGISTMATQTSAISFISIPAFVALKNNGGLSWLQYELALPLSMIVIMVFLIPFFRELKLVSIYEYLDQRFNKNVRIIVSITFLLSRGLGTGVALYAAAIVLSVCSGLSIGITILTLGVATVIYDVLGGIRAVIYSDIIQMIVLVIGLVVCVFTAADMVGGFSNFLIDVPNERMQAIVPSTGLNGETDVPFWAFLIGGFFLYLSYYGTDQSQAQRGLSASSVNDVKKALMLNGILRFPLTCLYVFLGLAMLAVWSNSNELQALVPSDKPDYLVPYFIVTELPEGLKGVLFAALLAATMSSLDSSLNSLSAVTTRDFIQPKINDEKKLFRLSKIVTLSWGCVITFFAFWVGGIADTVIEGINKIGSAFYGPILATFLLGILIKRITSISILYGLFCGVVFNLVLWVFFTAIHWMWWNVCGFFVTSIVSLAISFFTNHNPNKADEISSLTLNFKQIATREKQWLPVYWLLALYFVLILFVLLLV